MQFLKLIDKTKADGQAQPLTRAIREAVRHNILKDYLERKGGETLSILTAEYDFDTAMAVKQEEAYAIGITTGREEGISIGLERGAYEKAVETAKQMLLNGINIPLVANCTNLPMETVLELAQTK